MTHGDVFRGENSTVTDSAYSRSTVLVEERLTEEAPTFGDSNTQSASADRCGRYREGGNGSE